VLAAEADVMPADDLGIGRHRHPGGDVAGGCGGEVSDFGQEAGSFAGWHLLGDRLGEAHWLAFSEMIRAWCLVSANNALHVVVIAKH
jgi:hypothetical protein